MSLPPRTDAMHRTGLWNALGTLVTTASRLSSRLFHAFLLAIGLTVFMAWGLHSMNGDASLKVLGRLLDHYAGLEEPIRDRARFTAYAIWFAMAVVILALRWVVQTSKHDRGAV